MWRYSIRCIQEKATTRAITDLEKLDISDEIISFT